MAVRKIHVWPDPVLKEVAKPVVTVDDAMRTLVDDLFETMYAANGVGLAANQVGVTQRVLVIDLDPKGESGSDPDFRADLDAWGFVGPTVLINPEIVETSGTIAWEEGCLSVPGITESVQRHEHVQVHALDRDGQNLQLQAHGLFAVAIQHEMDHLVGRVFVDYLSKLKRDVIKRKMLRLKSKESQEAAAPPPA